MYNLDDLYTLLENVNDPEVPILSILDLGIVRNIEIINDSIEISITPTYSGCPAMNTIKTNILLEFHTAGYYQVQVNEILSPAWTTDWMSDIGKQKLQQYGIAPPQYNTKDNKDFENIICPICKSNHTTMISQFGSTSCKSLFKCNSCLEPFDYFKCH